MLITRTGSSFSRSASVASALVRVRRHLATSEPSGFGFNDPSIAYRNKSASDLFRALAVFHLSGVRPLVKHSLPLLKTSTAVLGPQITHWALRQTFFGHFCAGETSAEVYPTLDRLRASGVGAILDYAAEADVAESDRGSATRPSPAVLDSNVAIFLSCIQTAAARPNGFAAVKVSALAQPELLQRVSSVLVAARKLYQELIGTCNQYVGESPCLTLPTFTNGMRSLGSNASDEELAAAFTSFGVDVNGFIDEADWARMLAFYPTCLPQLRTLTNSKAVASWPAELSAEEVADIDAALKRVEELAHVAAGSQVRMMVDAETTYLQPAIDYIVLQMQRRFNKNGFPTVYNTYQAYLRDSGDRARVDLKRAKHEGFVLAAKVVRGAYMVQERQLAALGGYEDPIQPDIEATHKNYDAVVNMLLENKQNTDFMVASHNEASVIRAVQRMAELGIDRSQGGVFFGQLLGMCDHITYTLASGGYSSYKYVPYGPIDEVLPYLIRRAEENSTMLSGAAKERRLIREELFRRLTQQPPNPAFTTVVRPN